MRVSVYRTLELWLQVAGASTGILQGGSTHSETLFSHLLSDITPGAESVKVGVPGRDRLLLLGREIKHNIHTREAAQSWKDHKRFSSHMAKLLRRRLPQRPLEGWWTPCPLILKYIGYASVALS